jgi:hypothetical protein
VTDDDARFGGLLDAEIRHRADPHSFSIPRSDVRRALERGDIVKLLFAIGIEGSAAERMWVEVIEVRQDGYLGRLDNQPQAIVDLALGAEVHFGPQHVAAIFRDSDHAPRDEQFAIVGDAVWRDGSPPTHAARLPLPDDAFSGWVLATADDRSPPPPDLSGYSPVTHAELSSRYRSFDSIEDEPVGTRWWWDSDQLEWRGG